MSWYRNGRLIDVNRVDFNRFILKNLNKDFGMESRLTIQQFTSLDYGLYNCSAQNEFGITSDQHDVFERHILEKISTFSIILPVYSYKIGLIFPDKFLEKGGGLKIFKKIINFIFLRDRKCLNICFKIFREFNFSNEIVYLLGLIRRH